MRLYIVEVYNGEIHTYRGDEVPLCVDYRSLEHRYVLLPYRGSVWPDLKERIMTDLDQMWMPETIECDYGDCISQTDIKICLNFQLRSAKACVQLVLRDGSEKDLGYHLELSPGEYQELVSAFFGQSPDDTGLSKKYYDLLKRWATSAPPF